MDPTLWSKLPEELLEHILSCLPLKTFLYLQSTCKHFKSLSVSPSFISKHFSSSSSSSTTSFLLLSHPQFTHQYFLYNSNLNSWRAQVLSLSSLLPASATLIASSKGMICFCNFGGNCFVVCNLLARDLRVVKFPKHPFEFECFSMVLGCDGYRLFVISQDSRCCVYVYDSIKQDWENYGSQFDVNYRTQGVCFNSRLYFTTRVPFGVTGFDFETGNWGNLRAVSPRELIFGRLVGNGDDKLCLFGGIGNNGIARSLKIWELSEGGASWVEIGSVPDMMCRKLVSVCFHNYEHLSSISRVHIRFERSRTNLAHPQIYKYASRVALKLSYHLLLQNFKTLTFIHNSLSFILINDFQDADLCENSYWEDNYS
ncbi:hypothetical protein ACET3Z_024082 [Daucus carota]